MSDTIKKKKTCTYVFTGVQAGTPQQQWAPITAGPRHRLLRNVNLFILS